MSEDHQNAVEEMIHQVVSIVSAYVSHNSMRAADLPEFIGAVHASISSLAKAPATAEAKKPESPAVPVKRSVSREYIVCLEDGKKFKSLRRHLSSFHQLTPDEYRTKWNLPSDYPMVAPAYSATRSQLAKDSGLGQVSRSEDEEADAQALADVDGDNEVEATAHAAPDEAADTADEPPKKAKRGRPKKTA